MTKKGSIKETGEEVSQEDWKRFENAVDQEVKGATVDDPATEIMRKMVRMPPKPHDEMKLGKSAPKRR